MDTPMYQVHEATKREDLESKLNQSDKDGYIFAGTLGDKFVIMVRRSTYRVNPAEADA